MSTALLDPSSIRRLAAQIGLRPTKQRGQNFVIDANTVRRIVALADVGPDDVVLEIGPGLGSLTLGLLETGAQVTAVEIEDALATLLPQTVAERMPEAADRLRVVHSDALDVTALPGPAPTAVVANLPYNVAVPVLLHVLATFPEWTRGLVMVQSEVADRLVAAPGSKVYGVPSVKLAWYADAARAGSVGPHVFWPAPNVDSGLVAITRHPEPTDVPRAATFALIDAAFAQRRKMLRAALAGRFGSSTAAAEVLEAAGVAPTARGETLTVEDFRRIARVAAQRDDDTVADVPGALD